MLELFFFSNRQCVNVAKFREDIKDKSAHEKETRQDEMTETPNIQMIPLFVPQKTHYKKAGQCSNEYTKNMA